MRKIHIIQSIIIAVLTALTIYITIQDNKLHQSQKYKPTPKVSAQATPYIEKQQLRHEIQILREDNERLKWYLNTLFEPAQRAYEEWE